jgi:hypothetical protein
MVEIYNSFPQWTQNFESCSIGLLQFGQVLFEAKGNGLPQAVQKVLDAGLVMPQEQVFKFTLLGFGPG